MRERVGVFFHGRSLLRRRRERNKMKLTTKTLRRTVRGAALAAILATAASAQAPSWPTPPAPAPEAESGAPPQAESPAGPESKPPSQLSPARLAQLLAPIALYPDDLLG